MNRYIWLARAIALLVLMALLGMAGMAQAEPLASGLAMATAGTAQPKLVPQDAPTPGPICGPNWAQVSSPTISALSRVLSGVASVPGNLPTFWAVGYYSDNNSIHHTLTEFSGGPGG